jgi:hypothetical protein
MPSLTPRSCLPSNALLLPHRSFATAKRFSSTPALRGGRGATRRAYRERECARDRPLECNVRQRFSSDHDAISFRTCCSAFSHEWKLHCHLSGATFILLLEDLVDSPGLFAEPHAVRTRTVATLDFAPRRLSGANFNDDSGANTIHDAYAVSFRCLTLELTCVRRLA